MAGHEKIPGPSAQNIAEGVRRERRRLNLTAVQLSERLAAIGAPLSDTGIHKTEGRYRSVSADDLMAFAVALDVPPSVLLLPAADAATDYAEPVQLTRGYSVPGRRAWQWITGEHPLADVTAADEVRFAARARPSRTALPAAADRTAADRTAHGDMVSLVVSSMARGVPAEALRAMFENAIATGLLSGLGQE